MSLPVASSTPMLMFCVVYGKRQNYLKANTYHGGTAMKKSILIAVAVILAVITLGFQSYSNSNQQQKKDTIMNNTNNSLKKATFAGGCFWCVEADFEKADGVHEAISGYTGGHVEDPTYNAVCTGTTGHVETVQVLYDPQKISYKELLDIFWRHVNPTDPGGQFADRGHQYSTVIYYHNEEQKQLAQQSKKALDDTGRFDEPVVTEITKALVFYPAQEFHQDYYK